MISGQSVSNCGLLACTCVFGFQFLVQSFCRSWYLHLKIILVTDIPSILHVLPASSNTLRANIGNYYMGGDSSFPCSWLDVTHLGFRDIVEISSDVSWNSLEMFGRPRESSEIIGNWSEIFRQRFQNLRKWSESSADGFLENNRNQLLSKPYFEGEKL